MATIVENGGHILYKGNASQTAAVAVLAQNMLTLQVDTQTALRVRPGGAGADVLFLSKTDNDAAYLPKNNPPFTGTLSGPTVNATTAITIAGTTIVDSSRNATFVGLTATSVATLQFYANDGAGNNTGVVFRRSNVDRWWIVESSDPETGSDAGSNFQIRSRNDAGTEIDRPVTIVRASGGLIAIGGSTARPTNFTGEIRVGGTAIVNASREATFTGLTTPSATISGFGVLREYTLGPTTAAIYPTGVTPGVNNCALLFEDDASICAINAITTVSMAIGGANKLAITGNVANFASGVSLQFGGTTVVDSSRNATFATVTLPENGVIGGSCGTNDYWRIFGGSTGSNAGFLELATADDGAEPIYVRQYTGQFAALVRTLTLLDTSGNTTLPGSLTTSSVTSTALTLNGTNSVALSVASVAKITCDTTDVTTMTQTISMTKFGVFGKAIGSSTKSSIHPVGVGMPTESNYALEIADNGSSVNISGTSTINLQMSAINVFSVNSSGVNVGGSLAVGGTTIVDSSRNATFATVVAAGVNVSGNAGANRGFTIRTAGVDRWWIIANSDAESGSDAGSNFGLRSRNDAGAEIDRPFTIIRASGGLISIGGSTNRPTDFSGEIRVGGTAIVNASRAATFTGLTTPSVTSSANLNLNAATSNIFFQANSVTKLTLTGTYLNLASGVDLWANGTKIVDTNTAVMYANGFEGIGSYPYLKFGANTVIDYLRNATFEQVTVNKFGVIREWSFATTAGAIYATGVTPAQNNYALLVYDDGSLTNLQASTDVKLVVGATARLEASSTGVNIVGVLSVGGTTMTVPDYVFEPDYSLMPLPEVEAFVKEHKHLPNVPDAKDFEREGVDVVALQYKLLEKIEELTLHAVAQEKRIAALENA